MKIRFIMTGKTSEAYLKSGTSIYLKRLKHYFNFEYEELNLPAKRGKMPIPLILRQEAELQSKLIGAADFLVLLDERGKKFTSVDLAQFIEQKAIESRDILFLGGGAYGFDPGIYERSDMLLSLSPLTFSHQMVRLIFLEQLYRAGTIIKGESYHHA